MASVLHYLDFLKCAEKNCETYKGGKSFQAILTIGTIVAIFSFIVVFNIVRGLIRILKKITLIKDHYLHVLYSLPSDVVHHIFQIFIFFKLFVFVDDEAFPKHFQNFVLSKPGLGIFYALILVLDISRIFVVFTWSARVQRDQGLALVRIDAFRNGTSLLLCRIPLMLLQRQMMDKFYFPNYLVLFMCFDNISLIYHMISSAFYGDLNTRAAFNLLSKTFLIISMPLIFTILCVYRLALQFVKIDLSECVQLVSYADRSIFMRKPCFGVWDHLFVYFSCLPYLLVPALLIKNYNFIRKSMKKKKSLLDNFILDKVESRHPTKSDEEKIDETLEDVNERSNVLNEVEVDDEVFQDHRISSSSGPYHVVGYSDIAAGGQAFNAEALEGIRDQTYPEPGSLKYLEFESMSRQEKHIWLKNGIDPDTGETAVNSEDENEDNFYSLSTIASKTYPDNQFDKSLPQDL